MRDPTVCKPALLDEVWCARRRREEMPAADIGPSVLPPGIAGLDLSGCISRTPITTCPGDSDPESRSSASSTSEPRRIELSAPHAASTTGGKVPPDAPTGSASWPRCCVPGRLEGDAERSRVPPTGLMRGSLPVRLRLDERLCGVGDGERLRKLPVAAGAYSALASGESPGGSGDFSPPRRVPDGGRGGLPSIPPRLSSVCHRPCA